MHNVFVYGTLRQGESNHHWLAGADCLGECRLPGSYLLYHLGSYPAVVTGPDGGALMGEVYQVDDSTLALLDELEEYPRLYGRILIATPFGEAWLYHYAQPVDGAPLISGGDWCQRSG